MKISTLLLPIFGSARLHKTLVMRAKKSGSELVKNMSPLYSPRGKNQKKYVEYLEDPSVSILLSTGPAGTGKTLFACNTAVNELKHGNIQKIILTRPVVSVEEELGFLPGSLVAKMDPWTRPIFDILSEFYQKKEIDFMLASGVIEISPLAFMRGRTFKKAFIIADEMQNSSPNQMLMLTTRIGEGSKMVITGDLKQSDRMMNNGLLDIMNKMRDYRGHCSSIKVVEMGVEDVERSAVVSKILDIYKDPEPLEEPEEPEVVLVSGSSVIQINNNKENDSALIPLSHSKGTYGHQNQQS
jgi:phosphate starvation-inducible PhoH-like protein